MTSKPEASPWRTGAAIAAGLGMAGVVVAAVALPSPRQAANRLLAELGRRGGVELAIDGAVRPQIWPPGLALQSVRVALADRPVTRIDQLTLHLDPAALLGGRLRLQAARFAGLGLPGGDSLTGTVSLTADGLGFATRWRDQPLTVDFHRDGAQLAATLQAGSGGRLRFTGQSQNAVTDGLVEFETGALAQWLPQAGLATGAALAGHGHLHADPGQISLDALTLRGPGTTATGQLSVLTGTPALVEAALHADSIDSDLWLAPPTAPPPLAPAAAAPPPPSPDTAPPATPAALAPAIAPQLPAELFATLVLSLDQLTWRGLSAHTLQAEAGLEQGALLLRRAGATLADGTRLSVDGGWDGAQLDGSIGFDGPRTRGEARFSGDGRRLSLAPLRLEWSGHRLEGGGDVALAADGAEFSSWRLGIDGWRLEGGGQISWGKARPRLTAALTLAEAAAPPPAPAVAMPAAPSPSSRAASRPAAKTPPARTAPDWLDRPLDIAALTTFDSTLSLSAPALALGKLRLEQAHWTIRTDAQAVMIDALPSSLAGGTLEGKARLGAGPVPALQLDARLAGADLAALTGRPSLSGIELNHAPGTVSGQITARGPTLRAMIAEAEGSARLRATGGSVTGIDLAAINRQAAHVETLGNVLALLGSGLNGGTTRLVEARADCRIAQAKLACPDIVLQADGAKLSGATTLTLDRNAQPDQVTAQMALTLNAFPAAPVGLGLRGPVDHPAVKVDANALQRALAQSGLGRALHLDQPGADGKVHARDVLKGVWRALGGR